MAEKPCKADLAQRAVQKPRPAANVESSDEEQTLKIELPNSRNTQVITEFIVEGHYMVVLHKTKKAAAKAALVTTDVMNALIRRAQMAGVRVTERSATGFRFAVPTYMERLITTNIRDEAPRQLMLEAFFSPVNARVPPPAALALMHSGFVEHVTRVLGTLPPGFLPVRLTSFVSVKATRCVDTEDEPPARAEDIDSVMEAVVAQMKEQEQKEQELKELLPYQRPPYLRETNGVSLYLKPEYQRPLYLKLRSQTMSSLALVACSV